MERSPTYQAGAEVISILYDYFMETNKAVDPADGGTKVREYLRLAS